VYILVAVKFCKVLLHAPIPSQEMIKRFTFIFDKQKFRLGLVLAEVSMASKIDAN